MPRRKVVRVSVSAIQAIEKQIAGLDRTIAQRQRDKEKLIATRDAMRTILGPLANGHRPTAKVVEKPARPATTLATAEEVTVPQAFRMAMQKHTATGLTPKEIREAVLRQGVKLEKLGATGNYLYSVIARALKRGEVVSRGGRYYRSPAIETEQLSIEADMKA